MVNLSLQMKLIINLPLRPLYMRGLSTTVSLGPLYKNKTVLYDYHIANEGKMVDFANYLMPVQYGKIGIPMSHKHVRSNCGLFDVSHMLQTKIHGKHQIDFMESLVVSDIQNLQENTGKLSLFTNTSGGIIDDLICCKIRAEKEYLYVVSNASCRDKDLIHMKERLSRFKSSGKDVVIEIIEDHALVALQGPKAAEYLQNVTKMDLRCLRFMSTAETEVIGVTCRVTRCGYTGEDGFEISIPNSKVVELCENLVNSLNGAVQLAGLGARDSLRLEAGLCLYGSDIDESTTPVEAMLSWTISNRREAANFPGADVILQQLKEKPKRKRVGLVSEGPPARAHCLILSGDGETIGQVTSGCPSPTLGTNIAMAYISSSFAKPGTEVRVQVRNKSIPATVTKMPFVKCNYFV